jgi:Uma2 family endonuclease
MTPAARDLVEERIIDALEDYRELMSEGTPHSRAKIRAYGDLSDHFGRAHRRVFLATELCVLYPGEPAIVPDLLAVMDVEDPDRDRNSWRVLDEDRSIDFVLEFRNLGKKHKDLTENAKDYARLGIREYFAFDCRSKRLHGFHLPGESARAYARLVPQGGVFPSLVLDLELGVVDGRLRFFKNAAEIPSSEELVGRLQKMTDSYQERLEEAEREREQAAREREEAAQRLDAARAAVVERVQRRLSERGIALTEAQRATLHGCEDFDRLLRWLENAASAATAEELFSED